MPKNLLNNSELLTQHKCSWHLKMLFPVVRLQCGNAAILQYVNGWAVNVVQKCIGK